MAINNYTIPSNVFIPSFRCVLLGIEERHEAFQRTGLCLGKEHRKRYTRRKTGRDRQTGREVEIEVPYKEDTKLSREQGNG